MIRLCHTVSFFLPCPALLAHTSTKESWPFTHPLRFHQDWKPWSRQGSRYTCVFLLSPIPAAHNLTTLRSEWHHDPTIASKRLADHGEERLCKTTLELRQEISSIRPSTMHVTPDGRIAFAGNSSGHLGTFQSQTLNVDLHIFQDHWHDVCVFPLNNRHFDGRKVKQPFSMYTVYSTTDLYIYNIMPAVDWFMILHALILIW